MDDGMQIRVSVVDRRYPIRIKRSDSDSEETIREAARKLTEAAMHFKQLGIKGMDEQDYISMAALQFAIKSEEYDKNSQLEPLLVELREINYQLSSYLEEE
jgi:hypothetical protein